MDPVPLLLAVALPGLLASGALGLGAAALDRPRLGRLGGWALLAAGALLLAALGARAALAGRAPWANLQETAIAVAAGLIVVFALLARRWGIAALAPVVALVGAGMVGLAMAQPNEVRPLVPALQAPLLLTVHVGSAVLAYAVGGVAFVAAAAEIAQRRAGNALRLLPPADVARAAAHRAVLVGFPVLTVAILLGSVWANMAWRSYWSNDPKELAAAATWLVYGGYLHAAGRRDRWGALAPWLLVAGFAGILFTWLGAGLVFVGEHSYAGS